MKGKKTKTDRREKQYNYIYPSPDAPLGPIQQRKEKIERWKKETKAGIMIKCDNCGDVILLYPDNGDNYETPNVPAILFMLVTKLNVHIAEKHGSTAVIVCPLRIEDQNEKSIMMLFDEKKLMEQLW